MATRPYELLARFDSAGKVVGVSVKTLTTVDGKEFEGSPTPLSGTDDPAFTAFAEQFAAAVVSERDALQTSLSESATREANLQEQIDAAATRITDLQERVDAIPGLGIQIDTLSTQASVLESEITESNSRIESLETEKSSLLSQIATKDQELSVQANQSATAIQNLLNEKQALAVETALAQQKVSQMSAHPDVIAAKKAADVAAAKQQQLDGAALRKAAEAKLVALGEPVPTIPK